MGDNYLALSYRICEDLPIILLWLYVGRENEGKRQEFFVFIWRKKLISRSNLCFYSCQTINLNILRERIFRLMV